MVWKWDRLINWTGSRKQGQTNKPDSVSEQGQTNKPDREPETGTDQQAGQCVGIGTDHNTGHLSEIVDNCPDLRTISG